MFVGNNYLCARFQCKYQMKFLRNYPVTLLLVVIICYLSLFTPPKIDIPMPHAADKWAHIMMYGSLVFAAFVETVKMRRRMPRRFACFLIYLGPVALSGVLELLQAYCTVTRSGDWLDFAANAVGGIVGMLAGYVVSLALMKYGSSANARHRR